MKKALKIVAGVVLSVCLGVLAVGAFLFHLVKKKVSTNAPHLVVQSTPAADLTFQTLDGQIRHLTDFKGKVVFLDLWGTWCIQCVAEMPTVQALYSHFRNDPEVVFLIVSRMDTPQAVERYAHRNGFTLPFYVTRDADIPASMYFHQYPATFLYSKDGMLAAEHAGGADWADPSVFKFVDDLKRR